MLYDKVRPLWAREKLPHHLSLHDLASLLKIMLERLLSYNLRLSCRDSPLAELLQHKGEKYSNAERLFTSSALSAHKYEPYNSNNLISWPFVQKRITSRGHMRFKMINAGPAFIPRRRLVRCTTTKWDTTTRVTDSIRLILFFLCKKILLLRANPVLQEHFALQRYKKHVRHGEGQINPFQVENVSYFV